MRGSRGVSGRGEGEDVRVAEPAQQVDLVERPLSDIFLSGPEIISSLILISLKIIESKNPCCFIISVLPVDIDSVLISKNFWVLPASKK